MDAHRVTLSDILAGEKEYTIPVFQRYYKWKKDRWDSIWNDINLLLDEPDFQLTHFIGPMVIVSRTVPYDIQRYLVIDGQQRLVTLTILLCAIRNIASKESFSALANLVNTYLFFVDTKDNRTYKLRPRTTDREQLLRIINQESLHAFDDSIIEVAYGYFFDRITETLLKDHAEDSFDYLNGLFEAVTKRLVLVSITLGDRDDPSRIFESLNFKQEKLTDADLIRNYVLMQVNGNQQEEFNRDEWEPFEKTFAESDSSQPNADVLTDFYYRYLVSVSDYFARQKVYTEFTKIVDKCVSDDNPTKTYSNLAALIKVLRRYANYYLSIVNPAREQVPELRYAFERFAYLDIMTAMPLMLSLYDRYHSGQISKDEFIEYLRTIESFVIRRSILRERTRGYGLDFGQAIDKSSTLAELRKYFARRGWPTDEAIRKALEDFPLYVRERDKTRLILSEIERKIGHKEIVDLSNPKKITIEHILPQTLDAGGTWSEMLGQDSKNIHNKYVDTLGNLTLTGYNTELGNKPFDEKKVEYAKHGSGSHIELNTDVLKKTKWTQEEIVERTNMLSEILISVWARPEISDDE